MKKLFSLFALAIACSIAFIPQDAFAGHRKAAISPLNQAAAAIQLDFPKAHDVTWKQDGKQFTAFFNSDNGQVTARYNHKGKLLSTMISCDAQYIPSGIQAELAKRYPDYAAQNMKKYIRKSKNSYYILLKTKSGEQVNWLMVKTDDKGKFVVIQQLQQPV